MLWVLNLLKILENLILKKKIDINTAFFSFKNSFKIKKKYKSFKIITAQTTLLRMFQT